jgi:hypothetical protein
LEFSLHVQSGELKWLHLCHVSRSWMCVSALLCICVCCVIV